MNEKEKIEDKCPKCLPEDHEWLFCLCETRNIALAKQLRELARSPWNETRNKQRQKLKNNPFLKEIPECYIRDPNE